MSSFRRNRSIGDAFALEALESRTLLFIVTWDGGLTGLGADWHDPANWSGDVLPMDGDDVVIDSGDEARFSTGNLMLNSLTSSRPLSMLGGSLSVTGAATLTAQVQLNGGTLSGMWTLPSLFATANPANALSGATINGDISLSDDNAFISITRSLYVNGLVAMAGDGATISFNEGIQTFGGNADVEFSGFTGVRSVSADNGTLLTLAPSTTFMGERGRITTTGSGSVINQGIVWANIENGTLRIDPGTFTNLGTLRATAGGVLKIAAGDWTNNGTISINNGTIGLGGTFQAAAGIGTFNRTGGTVTIDGTIMNAGGTLNLNAATGSWQFNGGQIIGGDIVLNGAASLTSFPLASGRIAQATVTGSLSWLTSNFSGEFDGVTLNGSLVFSGLSTLSIRGGLTLNGTLSISGDDTNVQWVGGAQSLSGAASILLRHANGYFWALTPLTIAAGVSIAGFGHIYGTVSSAAAITSDTAGKTLIIAHGLFQNAGALAVLPGAGLFIGDPIPGQSDFTNSGSILATGNATITVGPTSVSGPITITNTGTLTTDNDARLFVGKQFEFNPITVNNSGVIEAAGASSITLGTPIAQVPPVLNNTGVIKATGTGLFEILAPATTTQLGDLRASGGTVRLQSTVDNSGATLIQNAVSGSWNVSGGAILGGTLSCAEGAFLVFDVNPANTLDAVTVNGPWALSSAGARLQIIHGLGLFGTLTISGSDAAIAFNGGNQSLAGSGAIVLSGGGSGQSISVDGDAAVTSAISILGAAPGGTVRSGYVFGGTGSFVNTGAMSGDLIVNTSSFTNTGIVEAAAGATLHIQGGVSNYSSGALVGGTWRVLGTSAIDFQPGSITDNQATIILDGPKSLFAALASIETNSGTLQLSGARSLSLPGNFTNTGTLGLSAASTLTMGGTFSQSAIGMLTLEVTAAAHSFVSAANGVVLGGAVSVTWLNYPPPIGTRVTFLKAPTIAGTFTTVQATGLGPNRLQTLSFGTTTVSLLITPSAFPGKRT